MELKPKTTKLIAKAVKNWERLKSEVMRKSEASYYDDVKTPIGTLHWDNPNLLWVYLTRNSEGYEGSQTQLGLTREGQIVWEYQSHCSCNGYEDSHGHGELFDPSVKSYELDDIPADWEDKVVKNLGVLFEKINN